MSVSGGDTRSISAAPRVGRGIGGECRGVALETTRRAIQRLVSPHPVRPQAGGAIHTIRQVEKRSLSDVTSH
jgi:hypothetical protein